MIYIEGLREEEERELLKSIELIQNNDFYSDDPDYTSYLSCKAIEEYVEYRIAEREAGRK